MGRRKKSATSEGNRELSIAELQALLAQREDQVTELEARRRQLVEELESVEAELASLRGQRSRRGRPRKSGSSSGGSGRGPRGAGANLTDYLRRALETHDGPMKIAELADAVREAGYRSESANFRVIISQRLAKMDDVVRPSRGMYQIDS